jgi:anaerobic selenocysteine-containing dehydrogenase
MTPTAEIADYVLPAAHWLERDDTCDLEYMNYIAVRQKVVEPMEECWHDMKISIELAKRLPWANRTFLPWNDVEEFNEDLVKGTGFTFRELKEKSCLIKMNPRKFKRFEEEGFHTPTGKVELYSTAFEKNGFDPLPFYKEPPESPVSTPELFKDYPFILYTGGRHIEFFHSEGRQIPALRERVPDPLVEMHPDTARDMGIEDGEWIWIETPQVKGERVKMRAKVTTNVHPQMVHARHGWWFPEKPSPEHGCFDSNINVVTTDDPPREKICCSVRTRGTLCKVYKV